MRHRTDRLPEQKPDHDRQRLDHEPAPEPGDAHEHRDAHDGDGSAEVADFDPAELEAALSPEPGHHNANGTATSAGPDPFDPAALRLSQDFGAAVGVKKALLSIPVRKPDKSWFVRVHPSENYRLQTAVIELKEDREMYLVAPALRSSLATEATFGPRAIYTAINRQGVLFLWQLRLPGADGKIDEWSRTALEAANRATKGWVRVAANMALGAYDVFEANAQLTDPDWPDVPFRELLHVAFKDRFIDSLNHPVLRRLRGEI
jgi:hypothetical protein